MLKKQYHWSGLNILETHYLDSVSNFLKNYDMSGIDVLMLYQTKENYQNRLDNFVTLQIDLKESKDEIFQSFCSKNTRNEIRKNIRDDEVDYSYKENLSDDELKSFMNDLDWFMREKGKKSNISFLTNQAKNFVKNICITYVKKDDTTLAAHLYMFDDNRIRYTAGVSYRNIKSIDSKIVGRSNRGLHWFDMQLFKEKGIEIYDFGGIAINTKDRSEININKFKEAFSKNRVSEYQGNIGVSLKGKLALFIYKLRKKIAR